MSDPELADRLAQALRRCRTALIEYEAGLLDDEALRRELLAAGVVSHDGIVWLVDLERGGWCSFDGVNVHFVADPLMETEA